jgi:phage gpG-like protein
MRQLLLSFANPAGASARMQVNVRAAIPGDSSRRFELAMRAARGRLNRVIADKLAEITRSNFGPAGTMRPIPWAPYSKRYGRKHPGAPTLVKTGVLASSIKSSATPQYGIVTAEGQRQYAAAHQFGYPPNRLPARPFFPARVSGVGWECYEPAQREVERAVQAEVAKIFEAAR